MASSGPRLSAVYTGIDAEVYEKMCIDSDAVSCFIIHSKCSHSGKFDLQIITEACMILFLTVVWTMNRCNPSIYAGYSDFGFRNEIW